MRPSDQALRIGVFRTERSTRGLKGSGDELLFIQRTLAIRRIRTDPHCRRYGALNHQGFPGLVVLWRSKLIDRGEAVLGRRCGGNFHGFGRGLQFCYRSRLRAGSGANSNRGGFEFKRAEPARLLTKRSLSRAE